MKGINGIIIIGVGLFLLYLGFTGKLDCIISVFKTCSGDVKPGGASGAAEALGTDTGEAVGKMKAKLPKIK